MQVVIDEVVSHIRTLDGGSGISEQTLRNIVAAVMAAVETRERHREKVDEEHSLRNYQQRNQPWTR